MPAMMAPRPDSPEPARVRPVTDRPADRRSLLAWALFGSCLVAASPRPADDGPARAFRAGAAAVDVTPPRFPISMNGQMADQVARSASDRLHAALPRPRRRRHGGRDRRGRQLHDPPAALRRGQGTRERVDRDPRRPDDDVGHAHPHRAGRHGHLPDRARRGLRAVPRGEDRRGSGAGPRRADPGAGRLGGRARPLAGLLPPLAHEAGDGPGQPLRRHARRPGADAPRVSEPECHRAHRPGRPGPLAAGGPGGRRPADRATGQLRDALRRLRHPARHGVGRLLRPVRGEGRGGRRGRRRGCPVRRHPVERPVRRDPLLRLQQAAKGRDDRDRLRQRGEGGAGDVPDDRVPRPGPPPDGGAAAPGRPPAARRRRGRPRGRCSIGRRAGP